MPWKDKTVKELREEFIESVLRESNFSAVCRDYGITRKTGYKWLERYEQGEDLRDHNRRPNTTPTRTALETENLIIAARMTHLSWGARKLKSYLESKGHKLPCEKTINNILNRHHCISKEESLKHKPYIRFEKDFCNEMWQTDFKGEFKMQDGNYCFPLDIFDDRSRYALEIKPSLSTANLVIPTFREVFIKYGMPDSILSDNGAQFAGFRGGYTQFQKWLMNHDILPIHGRCRHPQTQGKIERFHRTMKQELLKYYTPKNIIDAERVFEEWRNEYNNERPHEALNMRCPAEVYVRSTREYTEKIKPYEYNGEHCVTKVNNWGYVRVAHFQTYLSETMRNEYLELRISSNGKRCKACYRNFVIAEFNTSTGELLNRNIRRL